MASRPCAVQRMASGRNAEMPKLLGRDSVKSASALCICPSAAPVECACAADGSVTDTPLRNSIRQAGFPAMVCSQLPLRSDMNRGTLQPASCKCFSRA